MKKIVAYILTLAMLLSVTATAFAKEIEIFGDGSKRWMELEHTDGRKYTYYDVLGGAKKREDTRDYDRFLRMILTTKVSPKEGARERSVAEMWNVFLRSRVGYMIPERFKGYTLDQLYKKYDHLSMDNILVSSGDSAQLDAAIRGKLAEECHKIDSHVHAGLFKPIQGLKELKIKGPSFYNLTISMEKGTACIGMGTIFYDFQPIYVEDTKVADSAAGTETDLEKLKKKKGFKATETPSKSKRDFGVTNRTDAPIQQTVSVSEKHSTSVTNSSGSSSSTNIGMMVGTETESTVKFPFLGESKLKIKAEFNSHWISTTTSGYSKTTTKENTYTNQVSISVPAHTHVSVDLMSQNCTYAVDYDYPIGIMYKAAHFVILNEQQSFLAGIYGNSNDAGNTTATTNLRSRFEHRSDAGYEKMHSYGRELDWSKMDTTNIDYFTGITQCIPLSISGGTLGMSGESLTLDVKKPAPIRAVNSLNIANGSSQINLAAGQSLNLSNAYEIEAMDCAIPGEDGSAPASCYGFDDSLHGYWISCDKDGNPADTSSFTVKDDCLLTAGSSAGEGYVKFMLDEESYPYLDEEASDFENANLVYRQSRNDAITNSTVVKVNVVAQPTPFTGKVELTGELNAEYGDTVRLDALTCKVTDAEGLPVEPLTSPLEWRVDGEEVPVSYKAVESGEHKVTVKYLGVESGECKLTVSEAPKAVSLALDQPVLDMVKGENATLEARVDPENADLSGMTWTSGDEKVATVKDGVVIAQGTGTATITCAIGELKASCEVTVSAKASAIALNLGKLAVQKGKKYNLDAPAGTEGTWSSKNPSIASVTADGVVTGESLGETELVYSITDAAKNAKFLGKLIYGTENITLPVAVRGKGELVTKVVPDSKKLTISIDDEKRIEPLLKPAKALDKELFFVSDAPSIVSVDDSGEIKGLKRGKAVITVTAPSGKSADITVTVVDQAQTIKLTTKKMSLVTGESQPIGYTITPEVPDYKPVFESKNPDIATVDENGLVTAVKKGKTTIIVHTDSYKTKSVKCKVTVK